MWDQISRWINKWKSKRKKARLLDKHLTWIFVIGCTWASIKHFSLFRARWFNNDHFQCILQSQLWRNTMQCTCFSISFLIKCWKRCILWLHRPIYDGLMCLLTHKIHIKHLQTVAITARYYICIQAHPFWTISHTHIVQVLWINGPFSRNNQFTVWFVLFTYTSIVCVCVWFIHKRIFFHFDCVGSIVGWRSSNDEGLKFDTYIRIYLWMCMHVSSKEARDCF